METGLFQVRREQLAPLFELEVAEVAEVAEDETTNPTQTVCCHGWMGGKKQQIRGFGSMSEQQRSRGTAQETGVGGQEPARDRPRQGRICSAHGESGVSTSAGCGESLA